MTRVVELLEQTAIWLGHDDRVYYVGELTDDHLGVILAYLNHHAQPLLARRRGDDESFERDVDPLDWLHDRPLYRRLLAEQRRRSAARPSLDETMTRIEDEYGDALRQLGDL